MNQRIATVIYPAPIIVKAAEMPSDCSPLHHLLPAIHVFTKNIDREISNGSGIHILQRVMPDVDYRSNTEFTTFRAIIEIERYSETLC